MRTLIMIVVLWLLAARAFGDESEAAKLYAEGTNAYTLGEYKDAIIKYRAAYKAQAEPALLYDIAQAYRLDGDFEHALKFYRSYLYMQPDAEHRESVEKRIHEVEAIVAQQKASQSSPPGGVVAPTLESKILILPTIHGHAQPAQVPSEHAPRLHWVTLGVSALTVAAGVYLVSIDNQGTCTAVNGAECPRLYTTKAGGAALIVLGAAGGVVSCTWKF